MLEAFPAFCGSAPHAAHLRAIEKGEWLSVETISTVTGRPVELNIQPTAWGLAVYFRDITERRRMANDLRARDAVLSLAELSAGIGVWDVDLETGLVRGTPQFFRIMGLPADTDEIPIQRIRELRHPYDGPRLVEGFLAARDGGGEDYEAEYRIIRADGELRWIFGRGKLIRDDEGRAVRYAGVDIDITERRRADEAVERLASIVESSEDAIVGKDLNGIVQAWNGGATRLFGYRPDEIIGKPITLLIPEDRLDEETEILARIRRGERVPSYETVRQRRDGSLVEVSLTVSPIRDQRGIVIGASKIARDITERRQAEQQQKLLLREMNHRIKNLFALALAIISVSARSASSAQQLAAAVRERLGALARAHDLTLSSASQSGSAGDRPTTLARLLEAILTPYIDPNRPERIMIEGPDIAVGGRAVTSVALLANELATNAAKYGALSVPEGRVDVTWTYEGEIVSVVWQERGGSPLSGPPATIGFGSHILEETVVNQLGGQMAAQWETTGLRLSIFLSIHALTK